MSYYLQAFAPAFGNGLLLSPGVASTTTAFPNNSNAVELTNLGATRVSVSFGDTNAVTASLNADYTILPGMKIVVTKNRAHQFIAHISSAAGGSLHIIPGEGF
jgi:hypothetical protein